jgi:ABC-2 type transport system permease protein
MTVLMVPLLTMIFVAQDPNGMLATVLTWVPFFTPFVLMNRMAGNPPTAEVVGGFALIIASVVFAIWFSGRIFRNGILRTGQPPKLLEFLKLARKA